MTRKEINAAFQMMTSYEYLRAHPSKNRNGSWPRSDEVEQGLHSERCLTLKDEGVQIVAVLIASLFVSIQMPTNSVSVLLRIWEPL